MPLQFFPNLEQHWSSPDGYGMMFQILGAYMEKDCWLVFFFFTLLSLQSDSVLTLSVL